MGTNRDAFVDKFPNRILLAGRYCNISMACMFVYVSWSGDILIYVYIWKNGRMDVCVRVDG
jgi:hypothetical protein